MKITKSLSPLLDQACKIAAKEKENISHEEMNTCKQAVKILSKNLNTNEYGKVATLKNYLNLIALLKGENFEPAVKLDELYKKSMQFILNVENSEFRKPV